MKHIPNNNYDKLVLAGFSEEEINELKEKQKLKVMLINKARESGVNIDQELENKTIEELNEIDKLLQEKINKNKIIVKINERVEVLKNSGFDNKEELENKTIEELIEINKSLQKRQKHEKEEMGNLKEEIKKLKKDVKSSSFLTNENNGNINVNNIDNLEHLHDIINSFNEKKRRIEEIRKRIEKLRLSIIEKKELLEKSLLNYLITDDIKGLIKQINSKKFKKEIDEEKLIDIDRRLSEITESELGIFVLSVENEKMLETLSNIYKKYEEEFSSTNFSKTMAYNSGTCGRLIKHGFLKKQKMDFSKGIIPHRLVCVIFEILGIINYHFYNRQLREESPIIITKGGKALQLLDIDIESFDVDVLLRNYEKNMINLIVEFISKLLNSLLSYGEVVFTEHEVNNENIGFKFAYKEQSGKEQSGATVAIMDMSYKIPEGTDTEKYFSHEFLTFKEQTIVEGGKKYGYLYCSQNIESIIDEKLYIIFRNDSREYIDSSDYVRDKNIRLLRYIDENYRNLINYYFRKQENKNLLNQLYTVLYSGITTNNLKELLLNEQSLDDWFKNAMQPQVNNLLQTLHSRQRGGKNKKQTKKQLRNKKKIRKSIKNKKMKRITRKQKRQKNAKTSKKY